MAASNRKLDQLKAKEAKQKKIAAVGFVLLVILMAVQGPKVLHHGPPPESSAAPPPTSTPAPGTDTSSLAPPSVAGTDGSASSGSSSSPLADTDVRPAPENGQLVQFDLFSAKDPFVQQVEPDSGSAVAAPAKPKAESKPKPSDDEQPADQAAGGIGTGGKADGPTAPPVPTTAVALLSVDGATEQVVASGSFPAANPLFQLASFTADEAQISVVGGQYQDGAPTLKLEKGHAVTLLNTADGTRYRIAYLGSKKVPTSSLPATPPPSTTTTSGTETTPAPTPPAPTTTTEPTATTASAFTG